MVMPIRIPYELPDWIQEGYIRDDMAQDHIMQYPESPCVRTSQPPCLGDHTYTELRTTKGDSIIVIGTVIWIGPLPTTLSASGSRYWRLAEEERLNETSEATLVRIYNVLGALHGHRIVGVSTLVDFSGKVVTALVAYVFDDNMIFPWTVEAVYVVDSDDMTLLLSPPTTPECVQTEY